MPLPADARLWLAVQILVDASAAPAAGAPAAGAAGPSYAAAAASAAASAALAGGAAGAKKQPEQLIMRRPGVPPMTRDLLSAALEARAKGAQLTVNVDRMVVISAICFDLARAHPLAPVVLPGGPGSSVVALLL